jgi:hypothetical protein
VARRGPRVTAKMDWEASTTSDAAARYEAMKRDSSVGCLSHSVQLRAPETKRRHAHPNSLGGGKAL